MRVKIQACGTMIPPLFCSATLAPLPRFSSSSHTASVRQQHPAPSQHTSIFLQSPGTELAEQKFRYYGRVREYDGSGVVLVHARARHCAHVAVLSSLARLGMRGLDASDELQGTCFAPLDTSTLTAFSCWCESRECWRCLSQRRVHLRATVKRRHFHCSLTRIACYMIF